MTAGAGDGILLDTLSSLLGRLCERGPLTLSPDMLLADIPGIDSLRMLQALALLEERFHVEIDVVALETLHRVSDVLDMISQAPTAQVRNDSAGV